MKGLLPLRAGNRGINPPETFVELECGTHSVPASRHGGVETMRPVVDRLQGFAPQPPGRVAVGSRVRLGSGAT